MSAKPRIALMGEFSAGKSTLSNLLIGETRSPVQVTATQLPPVWFVYGDREPYAVGVDGTKTPVTIETLDSVSVEDTAYIKIFLISDILELCDIIDMPGNSDPNMSPDVWQRTIHHAHAVVWCTHATQAWRQSEAAVWDEIPDEIRKRSLLLLTRFDKLTDEKNRQRVIQRMEKEAGDKFRHIFPISLLEAMSAEDDRELWTSSGAEAFTQTLLDLILELDGRAPATADAPAAAALPGTAPAGDVIPLNADGVSQPAGGGIAPKRVARPNRAQSSRPRPPA